MNEKERFARLNETLSLMVIPYLKESHRRLQAVIILQLVLLAGLCIASMAVIGVVLVTR